MESIKGLARRATQSTKERFGADSTKDIRIEEVTKKITGFSRASTKMSDKVTRLGRVFEELGMILSDLAADYKSTTPAPGCEMDKLADEMAAMGAEVTEKSKEFHKILKENAFDPITGFLKELPKAKLAEDEQKKVQLEFDFFRNKVTELKRSHQKDPTRIPRNEAILEKWRVDLHNSTEKSKSVVSELFAQGQKVIDMALFTVSQCVGNYSTYVTALSTQHFLGARLPVYPTAPILLPTPLPPSPFQTTPMPPGPGGYPVGAQPSQLSFGYDPNQQQQHQWNQQQQQPGQYTGQPGQYPPQQPGQYSPQGGYPPQGQSPQGQYSPQQQPQQYSPQQGQPPQQYQGAPPQQQPVHYVPPVQPGYQQTAPPPNQQQQVPPQQYQQQQLPPQQYQPPPQQQQQYVPPPQQQQPVYQNPTPAPQPQPQQQPQQFQQFGAPAPAPAPAPQQTQPPPQQAPPQSNPPPLGSQFANSAPPPLPSGAE
jgi:hypothetical protein